MSIRIIQGDVREELPVSRRANGQFVGGVHAWRKPKPHWQKEWLVEQYEMRKRPAIEIAYDIGCTEANVFHWLRKYGIARRSISEVRAIKYWGAIGKANHMHGKLGALNPRYIDGSSPERQRLYVQGDGRSFLQKVMARDNFSCVRCGAKKTDKKSLHVHHIKPWAGNSLARFDSCNTVTLCRLCHCWVHSKKNSKKEYLA